MKYICKNNCQTQSHNNCFSMVFWQSPQEYIRVQVSLGFWDWLPGFRSVQDLFIFFCNWVLVWFHSLKIAVLVQFARFHLSANSNNDCTILVWHLPWIWAFRVIFHICCIFLSRIRKFFVLKQLKISNTLDLKRPHWSLFGPVTQDC